jgi:hypothetical protein
MTEHCEYTCTVKEHASGTPWLLFEPLKGPEPQAIRGKILGVDLRPDTTLEQAKELAEQIRKYMVGLSLT